MPDFTVTATDSVSTVVDRAGKWRPLLFTIGRLFFMWTASLIVNWKAGRVVWPY